MQMKNSFSNRMLGRWFSSSAVSASPIYRIYPSKYLIGRSLLTQTLPALTASRRSISTLLPGNLKVSIGCKTKTITVAAPSSQGVDQAVAESFHLSADEARSLQYFSYKKYSATPIDRDAISSLLISEQPVAVLAGSADVRYCQGDSLTMKIRQNKSFDTYRDLLNHCREFFGLNGVDWRHIGLFQLNADGGYVSRGFHEKLPMIDEDSASGFLWELPIFVMRTDMRTVNVGEELITISVAGCKTYRDVSKLLLPSFPQSKSASQIQLSYSDGAPIDLYQALPPFSSADDVRVLHAKMIARTVSVFEEGCSGLKQDATHIFRSDAELRGFSEGLVRLDEDNEPVGEIIIEYHLLEENARYVAKPAVKDNFQSFANVEGVIVETEVAGAVRSFFDPTGTFHVMSRRLRIAKRPVQQEWDAVFYDPINRQLFFVEAKRKVVVEDVVKLYRKFSDLPALMKECSNKVFNLYADCPITLVLGGPLFEKKAVEKALQKMQNVDSSEPVANLFLCYPRGDRFYVAPNQKAIKKDLEDRLVGL